MRFLFRRLSLAVPDLLYFVLLFGGWIALAISVGMVAFGVVRKKDTFKFRGWIITIIVSIILIFLTMTGKIAPYCSFGG